MKNIFSFIVLFLCSVQGMSAANGSVYSRYGFGEISMTSSVRALSLGSTGTALPSEGYIDQNNPATLGSITRTLINGSYQYRRYDANDGTATSILNAGGFLSVALAFPIYKPYGIALAMGLSPASSVAYNFDITDTYSSGSINQALNGRGGLTALQMSLSCAPMADLALGATMNYLFGSIKDEHTLTYPDASFYASDLTTTTELHGFAFHIGALQSGLDKLLGLSDSKHLSLGATLYTGGTLSSSASQISKLSTADTTITIGNQNVEIPFGISAGVAYEKNGIIYTGDVNLQQWSGIAMYHLLPNETQNSMRAGFGIEIKPGKEFIETYWGQVAYRLGGYARQTNLRLNGQSINEYFATAGIGLPLGNDARLNIGLEYGIRGTTSSLLVKDNILRLTLSISAGDIWFLQSEIE